MAQTIYPCLWFNTGAQDAVDFWTDTFGGRILSVARVPDGIPLPSGSVLTIQFELFGQPFMALNGGENVPFSNAVSLVVECGSQDEIDRYWEALSVGGEPVQCGWIRDRYGLSFQIVPTGLDAMLTGDPAGATRVMAAVMQMVRLDKAALEAAYAG